MKPFLLLLGTVLLHFQVAATIRTVSNNPTTIAQFNTIQAAVTASSNGDTVYVHGSPNAYSGFNLDGKGLVIIGPGWRPDKNLALRAEINSAVTLFGSNVSGTELHGLVFQSPLTFNQNISAGDADGGTPINIILRRCEFRSTINWGVGGINGLTYQNHQIDGCYFFNININAVNTQFTYNNFLFQNNVFLNCAFNSFFLTNNFLFDHNLFYANNFFTPFSSCRFMQFSNNIFNEINLTNSPTSLVSASFIRNITFNATNNAPWTQNGNADAGGNLANVNPGMADQASVDAGTDNPLLNFSIASGPANDAGTDGKDLGLLFDNTGNLNWTNSRNSRIPRIFSMNITTPTVPAGGNVSVTVEARTSN